MVKSKKYCLLRLVAIFTVFLLVATTSTAFLLQKYHITVETELAESGWTELDISMPFSRNIFENFLFRLLERFPIAFPILRSLLGM